MARLSKEDLMKRYEKCKSLLLEDETATEIQKENLADLFDYLEKETNWLTAPASTKYHCSYEGGTLEHSLNVANNMLRLQKSIAPHLSKFSCVLIGLLHDCGKSGSQDGPYYAQKEPTDRQRQFGYPGSYSINKEIPYMNHEDRSLWLITKHYELNEEEFNAIAQHNTLFRSTDYAFFEYIPYAGLLAMADFWACVYQDEQSS